ncbi:hypothetical protein [Glutamicibacter halophytocola]|uniref:hypothetical protein n=1 Tax=Glutamicibacter halophytocola TaxID=1933880 RepID=UPI003D27E7AD
MMNRPAAFPVALTGSNDRVKMWAAEAEVEHEALEQLRRVAQLPWVHGVRVMPDVHVGKGGDDRQRHRHEPGRLAFSGGR